MAPRLQRVNARVSQTAIILGRINKICPLDLFMMGEPTNRRLRDPEPDLFGACSDVWSREHVGIADERVIPVV